MDNGQDVSRRVSMRINRIAGRSGGGNVDPNAAFLQVPLLVR